MNCNKLFPLSSSFLPCKLAPDRPTITGPKVHRFVVLQFLCFEEDEDDHGRWWVWLVVLFMSASRTEPRHTAKATK